MNRAGRFIIIASLGLIVGCAQWKEAPEATSKLLSKPEANSETAIVDIAFVTLPIEEDQVDWRLWREADEQVMPTAARRALANNGLRAGRFASELPPLIRETFQNSDADSAELTFLQQANLMSDLSHGARRVHCRLGRRYELPVREQMQGPVTMLLKGNDSITGKRFLDPLFLFSFEIHRTDDGEILLRMVPEVQHGHVKQNWVSHEQALRLDSRRASDVFDDLAFEIPISSGHVVLISPTEKSRGLGEKMLMGQRVDSQPEAVAIVLRLSAEPSIRL